MVYIKTYCRICHKRLLRVWHNQRYCLKCLKGRRRVNRIKGSLGYKLALKDIYNWNCNNCSGINDYEVIQEHLKEELSKK